VRELRERQVYMGRASLDHLAVKIRSRRYRTKVGSGLSRGKYEVSSCVTFLIDVIVCCDLVRTVTYGSVSSIDMLHIFPFFLEIKGYMYIILQQDLPSLLINYIGKYQGHSLL
jgi:hypothetical protein